MSGVVADPEKLKQFARSLSTSADQLQQIARSLARALENSGWDDSERRRFEQDYKQTVRTLNQFTEKLKGQYVPTIQKKAAALEQYRRS
ncbi:hypothetical protein [Phycicoccus sp.]|uniref:WXG100 family type VII secretion target n=1 Tax=Phycicoccus sp. TaxID=1902410 RepID=UPI002BC6D35A|nr:hypothetical protein [Phycicoccus sp.]HMM95097.1 hypothetical protein [Phycicoccus sp.]